MLKNIGRRGLAASTSLTNAVTRLEHFSACWKQAENSSVYLQVVQSVLLVRVQQEEKNYFQLGFKNEQPEVLRITERASKVIKQKRKLQE